MRAVSSCRVFAARNSVIFNRPVLQNGSRSWMGLFIRRIQRLGRSRLTFRKHSDRRAGRRTYRVRRPHHPGGEMLSPRQSLVAIAGRLTRPLTIPRFQSQSAFYRVRDANHRRGASRAHDMSRPAGRPEAGRRVNATVRDMVEMIVRTVVDCRPVPAAIPSLTSI